MPSVSKQQQKFMGIVRAIQKGDVLIKVLKNQREMGERYE